MGAPLQLCESVLDEAVNALFDAGPQIQAVGISLSCAGWKIHPQFFRVSVR
jgi:hypothetical protein